MAEELSHHMQDNSYSEKHRTQVDPANGQDQSGYNYLCKTCRRVIVRTEVPMDAEGLENKMRMHKCSSPGKQDFEMELR